MHSVSDLQHLMLIGAYRDNEVDAAHPLIRKLDAIRQSGARVEEIRLVPLALDDVGQLIADTLRCDPAHVAPLAQLVHGKTAGNPFFVIQFLYSLTEEGLLRFDYDGAFWSWDLDFAFTPSGYTDNGGGPSGWQGNAVAGQSAAGVAATRLRLGNVATDRDAFHCSRGPGGAGACGALADGPSGTG